MKRLKWEIVFDEGVFSVCVADKEDNVQLSIANIPSGSFQPEKLIAFLCKIEQDPDFQKDFFSAFDKLKPLCYGKEL